jgi:hypothetical protein
MDEKEMPKYKSHKEVWALKIKGINQISGSATDGSQADAEITPEEEGYAPFTVPGSYMEKHDPKVGGYYVVYKGGYKSFSPADAFEGGYTSINN